MGVNNCCTAIVIITIIGILCINLTFVVSEKSHPNPKYRFLREATSAPPVSSYYDYIIIGGGTAGCPLAATLPQNSTVLLLERGGSPYGNPNITNFFEFGESLGDTSPSSPSQRFVSEDGVINNRARVLGGGSCINAGFYSRAETDFVKEAIVGWDERLLNESYRWVENKIVLKPILGPWQSSYKNALLEAGVVPDNGFSYDHLYGTKVGGVIYDKDGNRRTAADLLEYANPDRLTVLLHASVMKILFRTKRRSRPMATGVVYRDASGTKHRAYLKRSSRNNKNEIIVSAGAIGSPQLLMLSGVGPAKHLNSHNITVILDQPLVGQGMSDNSMNGVVVPSPAPVEVSILQVVGITRFGTYIEAGSGTDFASQALNKIGLLTVPTMANKAIQIMKKDEEEPLRIGYIISKIKGPLSIGHLELKNRNPNDNPSVTFNYFKEPKDLERCVNGLKIIEKIIESKSFSEFRYADLSYSALLDLTANLQLNLRPKHDNSSISLEQFCKDTVVTIWHYHGGCQIGKVVDRDYKVMGLDSIRVIIDGSTFTSSPGTNPQATVMMLGRYMGVKILKERYVK